MKLQLKFGLFTFNTMSVFLSTIPENNGMFVAFAHNATRFKIMTSARVCVHECLTGPWKKNIQGTNTCQEEHPTTLQIWNLESNKNKNK